MHMDVNCNVAFEVVPGAPNMVHVVLDVEKNDQVECSFENARNQGSIKIIKTASGGDDTDFNFGVTGPTPYITILTAGDQTPMAMDGPRDVNTGLYTIKETLPDGWMNMGVECSELVEPVVDGNMVSVTVDVEKGEKIVCTFDNARNEGTLKIIKNASGGEVNGEFGFEVAGLAPDTDSFGETLIAGDLQTPMDMTGPVTVRTGTYAIWETIPEGWMHMDVNCNVAFEVVPGAPNMVHVVLDVEKNDQVECSFENARNTGTLKVTKITDDPQNAGNTEFDIIIDGDTVPLEHGEMEIREVLADTALHSVTEPDTPAGWELDVITCEIVSSGQLVDNTNFIVPKGDTVQCTVENERVTSTIKIIKNASGGDDTDFEFDVSGVDVINDIILTAGDQTPMDMTGPITVRMGHYTIWETIPEGWMHMDVNCNVPFQEFQVVSNMVHIEFDVDVSAVECSFENVRNDGSIKIIKKASGGEEDVNFAFEVEGTIPDTDSFDATLTAGGATPMDMTGPVTVRTGTYNIWETIPPGWMHMSVICDGKFTTDVQPNMVHVVVKVDKDQDVICTFENARNTGTLKVTKITDNPEAAGDTEFDIIIDGDTVPLTHGEMEIREVLADTVLHSVTEPVTPTGWTLDQITCEVVSSGEEVNPEEFIVPKGELVQCTVENKRDAGTLKIKKTVIGNMGDTFYFDVSGGPTDVMVPPISISSVPNLVVNGGFEFPNVSTTPGVTGDTNSMWNIYEMNNDGANPLTLGWKVNWRNGDNKCDDSMLNAGLETYTSQGVLEIQRGILGGPHSGKQHAELDSDCNDHAGVGNDPAGAAPVRIFQDLDTTSSQFYDVSFWYKKRPNTNTNGIEVKFGGVTCLTLNNAQSPSQWTQFTCSMVEGTGDTTTLEFIDKGTGDTHGTFLDDVKVVPKSLMGMTDMIPVQSGDYMITEVPVPEGWKLKDISCRVKGTDTPVPFTADILNDKVTVTVEPGVDVECEFINSTHDLAGSIRDFKYCTDKNPDDDKRDSDGKSCASLKAHPDFESEIGDDDGIVTMTLGGDGNPVYGNHPTGTLTTTSAARFDQWFNTVNNVNLCKDFTINLNQVGDTNTYKFSDMTFFPIDNQLFGNQGFSHNYHFTMELRGTFVYHENTDQKIILNGDDDIFLYIDGNLEYDGGGVLPARMTTVDLDTLGLTDGETYDLDLFFGERHTSESVLEITVENLILIPKPSPC
jgi:fibro-slime domain-containing protein